jgi:hypothetical protein
MSLIDSIPSLNLKALCSRGYTPGMKTAVSIPDDIFKKAERLARRMNKSRSQLFSNALADYVARHSSDQITEAMNQVCDQVGGETDGFTSVASRRTLERVEW